MSRPVIEETREDVKLTSTPQLYAKRALLEWVVNAAIKEGRDDWKKEFEDERISAKEQLDIINEELGTRNVIPPVTVNCKPGMTKVKDAKI